MKTHITFEIEVADVAGFLARLGLSGASAPTIEHSGVSDTAGETRSRRSRSTPTEVTDAAPAQEAVPSRRRSSAAVVENPTGVAEIAPPASETEPTPSRRRRTSASVDSAPGAPTISDLDLAKGASEAAEALTKLGDKGQEIVQDVLREDFGVTMVNEIAADRRQAFLDELQNQVSLAKAEAAKVQA